MSDRVALRRPSRLLCGDTVTVVAPSGPLDPDRLERGCDLLRAAGFDVRVGAHARDAHGYLAGADRDRAEDLQRAWLDPQVRAVLCGRGGYGAARVVDLLDWEAMRAVTPPVLAGGSDITSLHLAIARRLGVVTLLAPMPASAAIAEGTDPSGLAHLVDTLTGHRRVEVLRGRGALVAGRATGVTVGGTLSLLAAAVGTPDAPTFDGGVLLLEDVAEPPYRIDRMLTQLLRCGAMDGVRAVVAGDWAGCGPLGEVHAVLAERLARARVPILTGVAFGHGRRQLTVPLGVEASVDTASATLRLHGPALAPTR